MQNKLKPYQAFSHRTHGINADYPNLYGTWCSMKARCENTNRPKYVDYGKRGITLCKEWHNAGVFAQWALSHGYKQGLQIDRINNDKGYFPDNCRFVTPKENSRNRRNTKYLNIGGIEKSIAEWCETVSISQFTIYWWYRKYGKEYAEKRVKEIMSNGK